MRRQVVHYNNVAGYQYWHENLFDIGSERYSIHCAVEHHRRSHPRQPQRTGKGRRLPMAVRDRSTTTFSAKRLSANTGHFGAQAGLIDEDKPVGIEIELTIEPVPTALQEIGAFLLQCMCGLF